MRETFAMIPFQWTADTWRLARLIGGRHPQTREAVHAVQPYVMRMDSKNKKTWEARIARAEGFTPAEPVISSISEVDDTL